MKRPLPDPDLNLRDAADFILNSDLGRKALKCASIPFYAIFLQDIIATIYRLALSCQLPEFTDHGLTHLCSLVDRISRWTCYVIGGNICSLLELISDEEAAILLLATLFHDIGMLSQKPEDLEDIYSETKAKGQMDVATWVRKTHIDRLEKLVRRLFSEYFEYQPLMDSNQILQSFRIAKAHGEWPWETGFDSLSPRERGLAAIIAIVDLLDEDSNRCDTTILIRHRHGTMLNVAHWIRHRLTDDRVLVLEGVVRIRMVRPPNTNDLVSPVFSALRNHYRLIKLYNPSLGQLGISSLNIHFNPGDGIPFQEAPELNNWRTIPGLLSQEALVFHLLESFFPLSLLDTKRIQTEDLKKLSGLGMECIDLENFYNIKGRVEIHSPAEQEFYALF